MMYDDHFLGSHARDAEILGHHRGAELSLYDMQYAPVRQGDWHAHEGLVLELPLTGGYQEQYQHVHRSCAPGRLQVYAHQARHISVGGPESTRIFHVLMPASTAPIDDDALVSATPLVAALFLNLRGPKRQDVHARLASSLADIVTLASGDRGPGWLERARRMTHERHAESIGLRDVAAEVGVNPSHLGRTFRAHWGCSLGAYMRRIRVASAIEKLISTDTPLLETGLACGFADQSHFCREFTRLVCISPGRFRRRLYQMITEDRPVRQSA